MLEEVTKLSRVPEDGMDDIRVLSVAAADCGDPKELSREVMVSHRLRWSDLEAQWKMKMNAPCRLIKTEASTCLTKICGNPSIGIMTLGILCRGAWCTHLEHNFQCSQSFITCGVYSTKSTENPWSPQQNHHWERSPKTAPTALMGCYKYQLAHMNEEKVFSLVVSSQSSELELPVNHLPLSLRGPCFSKVRITSTKMNKLWTRIVIIGTRKA